MHRGRELLQQRADRILQLVGNLLQVGPQRHPCYIWGSGRVRCELAALAASFAIRATAIAAVSLAAAPISTSAFTTATITTSALTTATIATATIATAALAAALAAAALHPH